MSANRAVEDFVGAAEEWTRVLAETLDRLADDPGNGELLRRASEGAGRLADGAVLGYARLAALA